MISAKHLSFALSAALVAVLLPAPKPAEAIVMGIAAYDLVKLADDHDPATLEDTAVYYLDKDWKRRPFPNLDVFKGWFKDFSGVKELSKEDMAELRLGAPIVYRPGARLVKIVSDPKVYAVEPGGLLRPIASEAVAKALYGDAWAKRVVDVPDAFFFGYRIGVPLTLPVHTTGTVARRASDGATFVIEGASKRHVAPSVAAALAYGDPYIVDVPGTLDEYDDLQPLTDATERKYRDASQDSRVETLPPSQIEFPAVADVAAPSDAVLAAIRVTSGVSATIRRITVTLKGTLRHEGVRMIENVRIVDEQGTSLFGTQQVADDAGLEQKFVFDGAYALPENAVQTLSLKANVHPLMKQGEVISAAFDRVGFRISDDTAGGAATDKFYPRTAFPTVEALVK